MPTTFTELPLISAIDLEDERLVVGDTVEFVTKMTSYMTKLEAWSAAINASFTSINALGEELEAAQISDAAAIAEIEATLTSKIDSTVASLNQMSEIAAAIITLQNRFTYLDTDDVGDLDSQLSSIVSQATADRNNRISQDTELASLINLVQTRLNTIEAGSGINVAQVQTAVNEVNALLAQLSDNPSIGNVTGLQDALDAIDTDIAANAADIAVTDTRLNLSAILASKAITAVDAIIYDTSKDSDGGAWRHRMQDTIWYNEPLNTATRGSRKDFPSVAVIVAEAEKATIYDADDPTLPMWAVLDINSTIRKVFALNGKICIGTATVGIVYWSFVDETLVRYLTIGKQEQRWSRNIIGADFKTVDASQGTVSSIINSVAMTVLPDAPIDHATGLPVLTIAVGTDGNATYSVSLITDTGAVYDIASDSTGTAVAVDFDRPALTVVRSDGTAYVWNDVRAITSDGVAPSATYTAASTPALKGTVSKAAQKAFGSSTGLTLLSPNPSTPAAGMSAQITSKYNTLWMPGAIKRCWMSDTVAGNLVGGELVVNGTFDSDLTGWNAFGVNTSIAWNSNGYIDTTTLDNAQGAVQAITTIPGEGYVVSVDVIAVNTNIQVRCGDGSTPNTGIVTSASRNTAGEIVVNFVAVSGTSYVYLRHELPGISSCDNISVKRAIPDRSHNNKGLIIKGTLTRTPVAVGSDLVAFGGFSPTRYAEEPYSPDLDFGTGDFSICAWVDLVSTGNGGIYHRTDTKLGLGSGVVLFYDASSVVFRLKPAAAAFKDVATTTRPLGLTHVCAVRRGGIGYLWVNGVSAAASEDMTGDVTLAGAVVGAGVYYQSGTPVAGAGDRLLSLRISATAPSDEQIKKMYREELQAIQGKCTLYGTSDNVTALAYDDSTDLLHAGTSSGRSDFQGLTRVSNTTTPVTTAIAASGGMILEQ